MEYTRPNTQMEYTRPNTQMEYTRPNTQIYTYQYTDGIYTPQYTDGGDFAEHFDSLLTNDEHELISPSNFIIYVMLGMFFLEYQVQFCHQSIKVFWHYHSVFQTKYLSVYDTFH